jgi:hypothetical protein
MFMMLHARICYGLSAVVCLLCPVSATAQVCASGEEQASIVTFQVPSSNVTVANSINNSGAIAGNYAGSQVHAFVRAANGVIATFDVPGAVSTQAFTINDGGAIAGEYQDAKRITHGFIRSSVGTFTTFNAPENAQYDIFGAFINAAGTVTGSYGPSGGQQPHGFVRSASGVITSFDVAGSIQTSPTGINAEGLIIGSWEDVTGVTRGFFRLPSGQIVTFDPPGSRGTLPTSVNSGGTISGGYSDTFGIFHQFVRSNNGVFTIYNAPPGGTGDFGVLVNAVGILIGAYQDASEMGHSYVRTPDGNMTSFDVPGASSTFPNAISDFGAIAGIFYKGAITLSYVRTPSCSDKFQTGAYEVSDSGSLYLDGEFYLHGDPTVRLTTQTAGNASQHWQFSGVTGGFTITNLRTGQYASDQSGVLEQGHTEDLWTLTPVPWAWSIKNNRTGRLLADPAVIDGAVTTNGNGSAWQMSAPK